ncbi:MAG: hypothetical protein JSW28_05840 [Thermoplasmata archaeon]|nr:MAG: hypothetical protein JSW28_05840 [Thermoplasmata archaeon]
MPIVKDRKELMSMKTTERDKKKMVKNRERKIKKLMKEANWGREEAEKWVNYTESFDRKALKKKIT